MKRGTCGSTLIGCTVDSQRRSCLRQTGHRSHSDAIKVHLYAAPAAEFQVTAGIPMPSKFTYTLPLSCRQRSRYVQWCLLIRVVFAIIFSARLLTY